MILIALGGNLPSLAGPPPATFASALSLLERGGVRILQRSSVYVSPPWPSGAGPEFYNQAVCAESALAPGALIQFLLKTETGFGRVRREKWGPRTLDLDLIDYHGLSIDAAHVDLPHPRAEERAFVLKPVAEIAPDWRHPVSGQTAREALVQLDPADADACRLAIPA